MDRSLYEREKHKLSRPTVDHRRQHEPTGPPADLLIRQAIQAIEDLNLRGLLLAAKWDSSEVSPITPLLKERFRRAIRLLNGLNGQVLRKASHGARSAYASVERDLNALKQRFAAQIKPEITLLGKMLSQQQKLTVLGEKLTQRQEFTVKGERLIERQEFRALFSEMREPLRNDVAGSQVKEGAHSILAVLAFVYLCLSKGKSKRR